MNKKKRFFKTLTAIFLIAACIVTADLVPEQIAAWYDEKTLGTVDYTKITYEPYQISYYDSFAEKLDAISRMGGQIYMLDLGERKDISKDEELVSAVNRELEQIYQKGIMPKPLEVTSILKRSFRELCPVVNTTEDEVIQNAYIWDLRCELEGGWLQIKLDSEYQKIYSVLFTTEKQDNLQTWDAETEKLDGWLAMFMYDEKSEDCVQGWIDYWELDHVEYKRQVVYDTVYAGIYNDKKSDDVTNERIYNLNMPSGWNMNVIMYIYTPYYPADNWDVFSGSDIISSG